MIHDATHEPKPGEIIGWAVFTPDGQRQLVLDHSRAIELAAWRHGTVYPLTVPEHQCQKSTPAS